MQNVLFHLFRRMRLPLIVLIVSYAVSMLGLVLIPGMDDQGHPWRMDFFHAFYFVSFMGSTIGFGEIPYPFTDAQRLWTTFALYSTVISWLYAIGALLTIIQSNPFRQAVAHNTFIRQVKRIKEPFYLICGYGDTGSLVVKALSDRGISSVVIDINQDRINTLEIEDLSAVNPGLCANAAETDNLIASGLRSRLCAGVIAVTGEDQTNLMIALTSKLLVSPKPVICRAETEDMEANLDSFHTDYVINPYHRFANRLALSFRSPSIYLLFDWFTSSDTMQCSKLIQPPKGLWVICGYGRFGKAIEKFFNFQGIETIIVEADPDNTQPPPATIIGRGTEAVTLREANIEEAVGIVAGTNNDANNLSIIVTARSLKPDIFTVARQNQQKNTTTFEAAKSDMVMQSSTIIARRVLSRIQTPLLADFLRTTQTKDEEWASDMVKRIQELTDNQIPHAWTLRVNNRYAPALAASIKKQQQILLGTVLHDPRNYSQRLPCIALMAKQKEEKILLPDESLSLSLGDKVLFCGTADAKRHMSLTLESEPALLYCLTGESQSQGYFWRWLSKKYLQNGQMN